MNHIWLYTTGQCGVDRALDRVTSPAGKEPEYRSLLMKRFVNFSCCQLSYNASCGNRLPELVGRGRQAQFDSTGSE